MNAPLSTPKTQRGMTLLEVMVALLIFAMTGTAILKAAGDHLSSVGQVEAVTFANWVASNRLSQLQLDTTWPPKTTSKAIWKWLIALGTGDKVLPKPMTMTYALSPSMLAKIKSTPALLHQSPRLLQNQRRRIKGLVCNAASHLSKYLLPWRFSR